ncbi:MAG: WecB/TagA/CpsF family glycosyltransferase [Rhizobiales bacterium]|nr:WecB/TagA/CpsF family glycosyltransferase [Hyphomicrobiales bacterium]
MESREVAERRTTPAVVVGGIKTACVSRADLVDIMLEDHRRAATGGKPRRPRLIFDSNGQGISLAARDPAYRASLVAADLVHADSQWVVFASRLFTSLPIPEKSTTTDVFADTAAAAEQAGLGFFLLGATEEINAKAAENVARAFPGLRIVGRRNGYFRPDEEADICREINASRADIVWVGLGKPKEQAFCVRNRDAIDATWLITCGGCFKFLAGVLPRSPVAVQNAGFEWLHRLVTKPSWDLFLRYLTTNPHALYLMATRSRRDPVSLEGPPA